MNGCWTDDMGTPYWPYDDKSYCCQRTSPARFSGTSISIYRSSVSFPDGNAFTNALIIAWSRWNNGASLIKFSTNYTGAIGETSESNNVAYIPVLIQ